MESTTKAFSYPIHLPAFNFVRPRPLAAICFSIGLLLLLSSAVVVHAHPRPYPLDLQTTETVQHLQLFPWVNAFIEFVSALNDPTPSIIALALWLVGLIGAGVIARRRTGSGLAWFRSAVFLIVTVSIGGGLNFLINTLVARPRPSPADGPIYVQHFIPVHSFPSGHTEHDVTYYGFLLFLSFTPPVRQWRYRLCLLPLQILAVLDILTIGYSRILEGEHWLTDVLAGYLSGALWLALFIFLFNRVSLPFTHKQSA